jgi:hypothetical protein
MLTSIKLLKTDLFTSPFLFDKVNIVSIIYNERSYSII